MGNGLMTLIHKDVKYSHFFNKREIVTYKNINDLIKKIKFYIKNDRQRKIIAANGRKKYLKEFSSEKISNFIVLKTFEINNNEKFLWQNNLN